jgi:hypothetical protein
MVFTLEQNELMSYYRNGVKRDGEWTYSLQAYKEEFSANYPNQNVLEKSLASRIHRFVNCFGTTGSVENEKSPGRPKVIEDVVENIRDHLEEHPRTFLTRLSLQTGVPRSTCHKIVKKNLDLHRYKVSTVQELVPHKLLQLVSL